jgi:hypothetical protein
MRSGSLVDEFPVGRSMRLRLRPPPRAVKVAFRTIYAKQRYLGQTARERVRFRLNDEK